MIKRQEFAVGITLGMTILPPLMMTAMLMVAIGADFNVAGIFLIALAALATFVLYRCTNITWCLAPSVPLAYFLTYEMIISHGSTRSIIFSAVAVAAVLGLVTTRLNFDFANIVPVQIRTAFPVGLGLMLVMGGFGEGRLIFPSPDDHYVLANLSEPTAFFSVIGVIISAGLWSYGKNYALSCGMLVVAVIAWVEGFWALPTESVVAWSQPAAAWPLWENFAADFVPAEKFGEWLLLTVTLLWVMLIETTAVISTLAPNISNAQARRIITTVMIINLVAACCWCFPLRLAPENLVAVTADTSIVATSQTATATDEKGRIMCVTVLFLIGCAFFLPVVKEMTSFEAIIAPALIVGGAIFMQRSLKFFTALSDGFSAFAAGLTLIIIMGLTQNILSAVGLSWLSYIFLRYMSDGGKTFCRTEILTVAIWAVYFILSP